MHRFGGGDRKYRHRITLSLTRWVASCLKPSIFCPLFLVWDSVCLLFVDSTNWPQLCDVTKRHSMRTPMYKVTPELEQKNLSSPHPEWVHLRCTRFYCQAFSYWLGCFAGKTWFETACGAAGRLYLGKYNVLTVHSYSVFCTSHR